MFFPIIISASQMFLFSFEFCLSFLENDFIEKPFYVFQSIIY